MRGCTTEAVADIQVRQTAPFDIRGATLTVYMIQMSPLKATAISLFGKIKILCRLKKVYVTMS